MKEGEMGGFCKVNHWFTYSYFFVVALNTSLSTSYFLNSEELTELLTFALTSTHKILVILNRTTSMKEKKKIQIKLSKKTQITQKKRFTKKSCTKIAKTEKIILWRLNLLVLPVHDIAPLLQKTLNFFNLNSNIILLLK